MKKIFLSLLVALVSTTLSAVPIQRTFLKTLELGKAITRTQIAKAIEISDYSAALKEAKKSTGKTYTYYNPISFGGIEWSYTEFITVCEKLAVVGFSSSDDNDNTHIYNTLKKALIKKYGTPTTIDNGVMWNDEDTAVCLTHTYGESKGGEMRHYVKLEYADISLLYEAKQIISDEL